MANVRGPDIRREGSIRRFIREKREWREHVRRLDALPADYRFTVKQIEKFMWTFAADAQMVQVLDEILELFEQGAAQGRTVLDVTGDDVAAFCQSVLTEIQAHTWTGKRAQDLNRAVHRRVGAADHG
jgi:DNA-binding ferritin-like protein (Dps family)